MPGTPLLAGLFGAFNPFSVMPGNFPGLTLLPILLYPGSFPCCIQCSMRPRPKYFRAHIHVKQFICWLNDDSTLPISFSDPCGIVCISLVSLENSCTTSYFDLGLNAHVCFIAADFPPSDAVIHFAFLTPCLATYQCGHSSTVMFCAPQATWKNPD